MALSTSITIRLRDQFTKGLKGIRGHFGGFRKELEKVQKSFQLAGNMSLAADNVEKLGQQGQRAIRMFADESIALEDALSRVGAKTGTIGTEDFDRLSHAARDLGKTTTFTALEVAQAQDFMAQAGLVTNEILAATPSMLNLSRVGAIELGEAADIATNVTTGLRLEMEDTSRVVDVMAKAAVSANTDVRQMGDAMSYAAPAAADAGVSLEQLAGMMGVLGDAGVQASRAGTGVRAILQRLVPTSKAAQAQMRKLGIEVEDSEGNLKDIGEILDHVREQTAALSGTRRTSFLKQVFGERQAGVASILLEAVGDGKLQRLTKELDDAEGEADRLADQMVGPTKKAILELESAWSGFKDEIGQELLPVLQDLMEELKPVIADLSRWAKDNPELVRTLASTVIKVTALSVALGPLIRIAGAATTAFGLLRAALGMTGVTKAARAATLAIQGPNGLGAALSGKSGLTRLLGSAGLVAAAGAAGYQVGQLIDELFGLSDILGNLARGARKAFADDADTEGGLQGLPSDAQVMADGTVMSSDGKVLRMGKGDGPAPRAVREAREAGATTREEINRHIERRRKAEADLEDFKRKMAGHEADGVDVGLRRGVAEADERAAAAADARAEADERAAAAADARARADERVARSRRRRGQDPDAGPDSAGAF